MSAIPEDGTSERAAQSWIGSEFLTQIHELGFFGIQRLEIVDGPLEPRARIGDQL
jgi:hypothetical protein